MLRVSMRSWRGTVVLSTHAGYPRQSPWILAALAESLIIPSSTLSFPVWDHKSYDHPRSRALHRSQVLYQTPTESRTTGGLLQDVGSEGETGLCPLIVIE